MRNYEPCLCGADDCPECYPGTWQETRNVAAWENSDTKLEYEEWLDDQESAKEEYELSQAEDRADRGRDNFHEVYF